MLGSTMHFPLTLPHFLERAGALFGPVEIVSRMPDRSMFRYRYSDFYQRSRRLAAALKGAGLRPGDRVATLMWNHHIHLEAYFGIPVCGGVLHTLNLRLDPSEIAYIVNHAEDRFLIVDDTLLPLYRKIQGEVSVEKVIVASLTGSPAPPHHTDYEAFLDQGAEDFTYPSIEEDEALGMCYTSGTTGRPKGVVYSHRAVCLHSLMECLPDGLSLSNRDCVTAVVPMFHANAWGLPFAAVLAGCKIVFPGCHLDAASLLDLFESERVNFTAGVPTIWFNVLNALHSEPGRWKLSPEMRMAVGGSAVPENMIREYDKLGLMVYQAWGMTETAPLGTMSRLKAHMLDLPEDERYAYRAKQGWPAPLVELRVCDDSGELPWDGESAGELQIRGSWVASSYYKQPEEQNRWTTDGWFRTGDVATIDGEGFVKITDRTKDLIKTGGEWISSVDLENRLMAHPSVREAAVIAVPDPKWQERPLAVVVLKENKTVSKSELCDFLSDRFAKWQLPDDFLFVDALPHTSTGKFKKSKLREMYRDWKPQAE